MAEIISLSSLAIIYVAVTRHAESCLTFFVKRTGRRSASFAKSWTWPGNPSRSTSGYWRRPIW